MNNVLNNNLLRSNIFNSLKAISIGVNTVLILGLVNQLMLIMAMVGYNSLIKISPAFIPWTQIFTYTLGGLGYFIVMTCAGLLTAMASERQAYSHAAIAAVLGSSISLYLSLQQEIFTLIALIFMMFGIGFATFGCWLWQKHLKKTSN